MSTNHRKRKHRSAARHHDPHSHSQSQHQVESFLSHHAAYLNQHQNSSSSSWAGVDHARGSGLDGRGDASSSSSEFQHRHQSQTQWPPPDPLQALYIQAHEADIIRGPSARIAAQSLDVVEYHVVPLPPGAPTSESAVGAATEPKPTASVVPVVVTVPKIGSALIEWGGGSRLGRRSAQAAEAASKSPDAAGAVVHAGLIVVDDDVDDGGARWAIATTKTAQSSAPIWVDRYDARLLLDTLPNNWPSSSGSGTSLSEAHTHTHAHTHAPSSPTGWSDLSSDTEDTFFFDPRETEDFRREKRRRVLEHTREERLRARMQEDGSDGEKEEEEEDIWGGSDEEPDPAQKDLMERTAAHLLSSPNSAQLEMRILANHGGDRRFAFLRGRWKQAWGIARAKARVAAARRKKEEEEKKKGGKGVLALTGYGSDSESDEDKEKEEDSAEVQAEVQADTDAEASAAVPAPAPAPVDPSTLDTDAGTAIQPNEETTDAAEMALKEARRKRLKAWAEKRKASARDQKQMEAPA